jgi:antitoxin component of MazEF toxin-antitoxin module
MLKRRAPQISSPGQSKGFLALVLFVLPLLFVACGGSEPATEDEEYDARTDMDTGYDATAILGRLTSEDVHASSEQLASLVIDLNLLRESIDFYTARRQAKDLSVDFRHQPMQASMAAALMDKWNAKPPEDVTVEYLEQAWAIRRTRKKSAAELAEEHDKQLRSRQARQSKVIAERVVAEEAKERAKVDTMAVWIESYRAATTEARSALARVQAALVDPAKKGDLGSACRGLFQATQKMDGRVFQAPDRGVARPLGKAWERFRTASRSCMKGEMAYLTTQLGEGQAAIFEVNKILEGYGKIL